MPISDYSTTASENDTAGSVNFSEGQNPSTVNNSARQVMADIRAQWQDAERFDWGHTVTWATVSTFNIASDVTAQYVAGRAIRCYGPIMGTIDTHVVSSSYGAPNTTVTVISTGLLGDLSQAYLGIISSSTALPQLNNLYINEAVALTSTSTELNILDGATLTTAELNYVDGVTSAIQTQMDLKAPIDDPVFTGGGRIGTTTIPADGAFAAQNGLYHGTNRNNRTVILDTPELITSTPTTGAWTTVNNTTLNTALATGAIIRCGVESSSGSAATTDQAEGAINLRKTGSGLATSITVCAYSFAKCSVVGEAVEAKDTNDAFVNLDGSYDFDYYATDTVSGGGANAFSLYLVGYIQNC